MSVTTFQPFKIEIEQLNIVGKWDFVETGITDHKCNLCKRHIMAPSYEKLSKGSLDSKISLGKCKHSFHTDCIATVLKKTSSTSCPICHTPWNLDHELDSNASYRQLKIQGPKSSGAVTGSTGSVTTTAATTAVPITKPITTAAPITKPVASVAVPDLLY